MSNKMYLQRLWILISFILPTNAILLYGERNVTNQIVEADHGSHIHVTCGGGSTPTWKKGNESIATSLSAGVFQTKSSSISILVIKSLIFSTAGVYSCHISTNIIETVTFSTLAQPPPSTKVQGVTVTRIVQGLSPALRVSWSAVNGSGITYTVCYSTTSGTQSDPPSNANCGTSGITGISATLGPLSRGTTYYIWVAAVSAGRRGPYSDVGQGKTYNVPGAVTSLQARPSTTIFGLIIRWAPPSGSSYPIPITYRVRYRERPSSGLPGSWSSTVTVKRTGTQRQYTTPVLRPGTSYEVEVWPVSVVGNGRSILRTSSTRQLPGTVSSLKVKPSPTIFGLIITWGPPSGSNYPTPVTYQLRYRERLSSGSPDGWSSTVQRTATQRQYTTPVLKPGTRYEVDVWAVTSIGRGHSVTGSATTYQLPDKVESIQVRPSTTIFGLIITWGPPFGSNYPTPVTYQLRYRERPSSGSPGGWSSTVERTATQRQYTTPVLKPGIRYEVEVWSFVSSRAGTVNTIFGTTASGSVQALNVRLNGTQIALVVTWRPPSDITNPTGYRLRYHKTSSSTWSSTRTIDPQQTPYIITGLEEGGTYEVEVWAIFPSGEGIRRKVTAGNIGQAAIQITAVTTHSITLVPSPPSGTVYYKEVGSSAQPRRVPYSNTITITLLQPNTEYNITYVTGNGLGVNRAEMKQFTLPTAVSHLLLSTVSANSIVLKWKAPARNNLLTYHVNYGFPMNSSNFERTASTTLTLTGLHPYEEYTITVQAGNRAGLSVPVTGTARTYSDVPRGQPRSARQIESGSTWILLTWNIPLASARNGIIITYIIDLSTRDANLIVNTPKPAFSTPELITYNITGLSPGTEYSVRVAASTVNGTGTFGPGIQIITSDDFSERVKSLMFEPMPFSNGSVRITWQRPANSNGRILGYKVTYGPIGGDRRTLIAFNESVILTGLQNEVPYHTIVRARTSKGFGVRAGIIVFSKEGVPTKPVGSVEASWNPDGSVLLSWQPLSLTEAKGFPLYIISYKSADGSSRGSVNTTRSSMVITGLSSKDGYIFLVQVTTENGNNTGDTEYTLLIAPMARTVNDNTAVIVGVLFGGIAIGVVSVLLVLGIVCGVYKLRKWKKFPTSTKTDPTAENKVDASYEKVDEANYAEVTIITSPAYERVTIK